MRNEILRQTWRNMLRRCYNPAEPFYKYYGAKGVTVCTRWQELNAFRADLEQTWFTGATLERKDPAGNYEPTNCLWIPKEDQTTVGKQGLRYNSKTGAKGVELLKPGLFRVLVRERGWPRGAGPKHTLYRGPDFNLACAIRLEWEQAESLIPASTLKTF